MEAYGPWNEKFIRTISAKYGVTPKATLILVLIFVDNMNYEAIEESKYKIKKGTAQKRMTSVYQKFGISGNDKGKDIKLKQKLLPLQTEYEREKSQHASGISSQYMPNYSNAAQESSSHIDIKIPWEYSLSAMENIRRLSLAIENDDISPELVISQLPIIASKLPISYKQLISLMFDSLAKYFEVH